MNELEFRDRLHIEVTVLEFWIEQGWVIPAAEQGRRRFREIDLARGELIRDLTDRMGVNDDGIDIVMDLLDQIHGLRSTLNDIMAAISRQGEDVQYRILRDMDRPRPGRRR